MCRYIFALIKAYQYRASLKLYVTNSEYRIASVTDLSPVLLRKQEIQCLVLDFDGVLASHGETKISPSLVHWLKDCIRTFEKNRVFVLTNKYNQAKEDYFRLEWPEIVLLKPPAKKPYPDGILAILKRTGLKPEALLVIDDRLLTGILAAILAKTQARFIIKPLQNFSKRPIVESFFVFLRWIDGLIVR